MIELRTHEKEYPGSLWDSKRKAWVSYRVDFMAGGKRYRNGGFAKKKDAQEFIDRVRSNAREGRVGLTTQSIVKLRQLFDSRLTKITHEKEIIRATRVFRVFIELVGNISVTDVRPKHFQLYINSRLKVKPETVNREITILSAAFKSAMAMFPHELENAIISPVLRVKVKRHRKSEGIITNEQKDLLINAILTDRKKREKFNRTNSRKPYAEAFEFAWLLGLRFGEVLNLKPSDYNASANTLRVYRSKTKTTSILKFIPDRAVALLKDVPFKFECSENILNDILKEACKTVGIRFGKSGGVTFHSTRHSFTTRMVQVTDLATVQSYTGHSDREMIAYYSHATPESQKAAMEALYGKNKVISE